MLRGWVTIWLAMMLVLGCAPAFGQSLPPVQGQAPTGITLPGDAAMSAAPAVGPRTAFQPPPTVDVGPAPQQDMTLPPGTAVRTPPAKPRRVMWGSRYGTRIDWDTTVQPDGVRRLVFTGAVIFNVTGDTPADDIELAADGAVMWIRGLELDRRFQPEGAPQLAEGQRELEFYLTGNVIIRNKPKLGPPMIQTLRGNEIYYDVERERAIALKAQFQYSPVFMTPNGQITSPDPFYFQGEEIDKLDAENYQGTNATFHSSKTPSDPGIRLDTPRMYMTDRLTQLRNVFGIPYRDFSGQPVVGNEKIITAWDAVPKVEGIPVFYFPWYRADANEPLGPFETVGFGDNHVFGFQVYTTWNMFELLAIKPPVGQSWDLELDDLNQRGFGFGSDYKYHLPPADPASGLTGADGLIKYYGINDHGLDDLGGFRGPEPVQPSFRERFLWRHQQDFGDDLFFQGQLAYVSDRNFIEQYYKQDWDLGPNQETFADLTWQHNQYWASGLFEQNLDRPWIPETNWLPRVDGAIIGQSLLDRLVYSARGSAAYAQDKPTTTIPVSILPTDKADSTGRIDVMQELSAPFSLGPVRLAPYALLDLTGYSSDLDGQAVGRVWGGGGLKSSLPLSHLYEDVTSDLFNVQDLYHKVTLNANYLYAKTNVHYYDLPFLDRLNDDATDQSWRNMKPLEGYYYPGATGAMLQNSPLYDPQLYAIRRAVLDKPDTLDDMNVLQLDVNQRLQTKRGYPGEEHEVDFMVLDTSISYFPQASYNLGHNWAFAEWDYLWNVGDRMSLVSTGWIEPYSGGSRYWTVGAYLNRPDRTNFYIGYRQTDPLNSRVLTASVSYQLSQRYFLNGSASYDFGLGQAMSNAISLTRTGTDLTITFGITYNSLVNNFGVMFMIMPNAFAAMAPANMGGGQPMPGAH